MSDSIKLSPKHGLNPSIPACFWCGQSKNEIALMGKIDKEDSKAPMKLIVDYEPCDKCKELFSKGVHVIGVIDEPVIEGMFPIYNNGTEKLYPTGSDFIAPEDWITNFLTVNEQEDMIKGVLDKKKLLMPDSIVNEIIKDIKIEEGNNEDS